MSQIDSRLKVREWIEQGYFSSLGHRPDRLNVQAILGEPDDFGAGKNRLKLWRYGAIEFHFTADGELLVIHVDNFGVVSARDDMWGLDHSPDMKMVKSKLADLQIRFEQSFSVDSNILRTETDVVLSFDTEGSLESVSQQFEGPARRRQVSVTLDDHHFAKLRMLASLAGQSMSGYLSVLAADALDECIVEDDKRSF